MFLLLLLLGPLCARASELHEARGWLRLGHYQRTLTGYESEADGPGFFLSPEGKTNPAAELAATVRALGTTTGEYGKLRTPAACAFPARKLWLEAQGLVFPAVACPAYEEWRRGLPVNGAALVFASAYPNNPASMFGHTLLRFTGPGAGTGTVLLDYALNFAATTGEDTGFAFALFGVFGGYEGHFSLAPYFMKVNEYAHVESRDLWEYPLRLSPRALDRLLAHLWELEATTHFDYYFFDENCSWQLLRLLEAADEGLELSSALRFVVVPGETVKVLRQQGLLGRPVARPSLRKQYAALAEAQHPDASLLAYRIRERRGELTGQEKLDYHRTLAERAKTAAPARPEVRPSPNRPDLGHGYQRAGLSGCAGESLSS